MSFDLLLRNGLVIDGSGQPGVPGDVALSEGRLAAIGDLPEVTAARVYDCHGLAICPGFIDVHGHSDLTLLVNPRAESKVHMGITSECSGQCGLGAFPVHPQHREGLMATCSFIDAGLPISWSSTNEYLAVLRTAGPAINVAPMVAQSALRAWAMGFENRPATGEEIAVMAEAARQALAEGAVGISLGLAYALGSFASRDELVALCGEAAAAGRHVSVHPRNEGARQLAGLEELISIAREVEPRGHLRLQIDHLKCSGKGNWGNMRRALDKIEQARAEGLDIAFDVYPYTAGSRHLSGSLPAWMHSGGNEAMVERLRDPECRQRLHEEHQAWTEGRGGDNPFELSFADIMVTDVATEGNRWTIGKRLDEVASERNQDPLEATMDLLAEENGHVNVVLFSMSEEDMRLALTHPLGCVATDGLAFAPYGELSRGNPHPRSYGTFPRLLGRYVRELGLMPLEEAIRKSTSLPASRLALTDRGLLRQGMAADLVVFDPVTIAGRATFTEPHQFPVGVSLVIVNGQITVEDDKHTGAGAGQIIGPG